MRDGLVGVKRMEKAFQRQVIYGGSLDTILLEMSLIPEERLTQYLALASGLPPAARDEASRIRDDAVGQITREIAEQFRAVPISIEGDALRVLVCSPLEISELEDLADLLDRPLQPLITPEYRWHLALAAAYHQDVPARFETLARQLEAEAAPAPVGRPRSVIVDAPHGTVAPIAPAPVRTQPLVPMPPRLPAPPSAAPVLAPVGADAQTMKIDTVAAPPPEPEPRSSRHHDTLVGVEPAHAAAPRALAVTPSSGVPLPVADSDRARLAQTPKLRRPESAPIATSGRDSPLAIVRARELLATAEDRDTVFITLLRAARARARYAGLLTVQGGAVIGRVALAEPGVDTAGIQKVLIPLDAVSAFRTVVQSQQPHIGSLVSGDPAIDSMALRLGGTVPPSALLLPIVLRERVVAIVIAHRVHSDLRLVDVTELLPLASAAADAIGRLIVKHKAAGYRTPDAADVPHVPL
ncbi:MAG TPA: hypothetical protein VLX92_33930, partial [Kofleriaceae bacterium]|nr:hypothetical protein [Kofleriaceae bacterium]